MFNSYVEYSQKSETPPSSIELKDVIEEQYQGILTNQIKSIIAAKNITDYNLEYLIENQPIVIGTTSVSKVQMMAENIFGISLTKIDLPIWENMDSINDFNMDLAKSKADDVYACFYDTENIVESEVVDLKKSSNGVYTITREYYYYTHWGNEKPDYTIKAIIEVKKNSASSYGYNITSLCLE